jgi:two-component system, chemotaxis family, protein-glutamate methylesterase/glutaminase
MSAIKVLIVDDSPFVRQTYKVLLEQEPDIQVIGTAGDPYIAVQKIQKEKPDVITLDIEMPRMDGLTFLRKIMSQAPMPVIVISNQTPKGADVALKALEIGAVDVMSKPNLSSLVEIEESRTQLADKIRSAFHARHGNKKIERSLAVCHDGKNGHSLNGIPYRFSSGTIIAVGASTGGTEAIRCFLQRLPPHMPPILIVQHMPENFTASFASRLNDFCSLHVKEAEDNDPILNGNVYIAPGGRHMTIKNVHGKVVIRISTGELVNRHRPSVNVLFNSVAEVKGKNALGIILTGMGDDGATGLLAMHQKGAYTIAQDEATCVVFGMPHKAIVAGGVSRVLPLDEISAEVCERLAVASV